MLGWPNRKKRKPNDIVDDSAMEEEKQEDPKVIDKIKELERNYGEALTWIWANETQLGDPTRSSSFRFEIVKCPEA